MSTEVSLPWPPEHILDCCFKRPNLADPSPQDEVAQPTGRPVICRYLHPRPSTNTQKQSKTPITSKKLVLFPQQDQGHPSPREAHQQLNPLLLGLLHLHSTALYLPPLTSPFIPTCSSPSLSVPPWHGFMKSPWSLTLLCRC